MRDISSDVVGEQKSLTKACVQQAAVSEYRSVTHFAPRRRRIALRQVIANVAILRRLVTVLGGWEATVCDAETACSPKDPGLIVYDPLIPSIFKRLKCNQNTT